MLAATIGLLPLRWVRWPAAALGWMVLHVLRIRSAHALQCIERARLHPAPEIAASAYRSLAHVVFEFLWLSGQRSSVLRPLVQIDPGDWQRLRACLARGRGLVVASAHTGNWDLAACALASEVNLAIVSRHMSWRSADRFWQRARQARGVSVLQGHGVLREAGAHLSRGGVVAFMIDQAPQRDRGVVIADFLGAPAAHDLSFALLAARSRAPVALVLDERLPDGRHKLHVPLVVDATTCASREAAVETCLRVVAELERFVRAHAGQWLWLHRRWKRPFGQGTVGM